MMQVEALQAPQAVARQLAADADTYRALAADLQANEPQALVTVARGSSDHAAHYMGYLAMSRLGRLVTSLPMSLVTLYPARLRCAGLVSLAFSQSGQSPDLVAPSRFFAEGGARTVAFVNDPASPLARACRWVLPLHAGAETSVAATKSFIAQLAAGARLVATWEAQAADADTSLLTALAALPAALDAAARCDWRAALPVLTGADRLFVIGRGPGLAVALEAALKFKETCGLQAEAFSGAELRHGPMALVDEGYPMLIFAPRGPAQAGLLELARDMRQRGARVLLAAPTGTPGAELPLATTGHEDLDPIAAVQSFYPMVEQLARARGYDPDAPRHLAKVTRTR
ncbi:MAG TPA: SIS domain-containing protein [Rubrivivax sp.]|nr:SIS domain-containing protein [Rubrivivax sp.]